MCEPSGGCAWYLVEVAAVAEYHDDRIHIHSTQLRIVIIVKSKWDVGSLMSHD